VLQGLQRDRVYWQPEIWIAGVHYKKGLGMHAPKTGVGVVRFKVPPGYTIFISLVGLARQDKSPGCAKVGDARFRVYVNDELQFHTGIVKFNDLLSVRIPVRPGDILKLEVDKGTDDYTCDHNTWAEARFEP
jgi:hypothetical protein